MEEVLFLIWKNVQTSKIMPFVYPAALLPFTRCLSISLTSLTLLDLSALVLFNSCSLASCSSFQFSSFFFQSLSFIIPNCSNRYCDSFALWKFLFVPFWELPLCQLLYPVLWIPWARMQVPCFHRPYLWLTFSFSCCPPPDGLNC